MKRKVLVAVVYAMTAAAVANHFEDVDGLEPGPITGYFGLIQTAIAGAILFAIACLLSLLALRFGAVCGFVASILSWFYFGTVLFTTRWSRLISLVMESPLSRNKVAALLMLIISTAFSLAQLRMLFRRRSVR